jgi:asparagine synthase (glutamine-hydrolysing)
MFAVAIWDASARQLTLARDRVGKKPLFYAEQPGGLSFGSEVRALLQDNGIPIDIDHRALDCYLAFQYVPAPLSAYRAVKKLPPATTLVYRNGTITMDRYWRLDFAQKCPSDHREVHEAIRTGILDAVRRRLVADVPLGAFLSGGVDSSAVVAAMAQVATGPVKTFSIGFESERYDELSHARGVAQRFATDHHEFVVKPDAAAMIPRIVRHYGEPFADSSAIPSFHLAELARRHVTVALNGDGGDEVFGGYPRYSHIRALRRLDRLPRRLRGAVAALGSLLPSNGDMHSISNRARRLAYTVPLDTPSRYFAYMSSMGGGLRRDLLYTPAYRDLVGESVADDVILEPWRRSSASDLVDVMLDVDIATYLPGDLLTKMDIATMAFSLEARSPLLDHEVLELAASLPPQLKVNGKEKKVALRSALRAWLPDEVLDRPKQGFEVPIAEWFRTDLREQVYDVVLGPRATGRGYFERRYVERLVDRHISGADDNAKGIWTLLMFELWHQEFVDSRPATAPAMVHG